VTTVAEIAEPLAGICVPVPSAGQGICERCHNRPTPGFRLCYSCEQSARQVSRSCQLVVPISLYAIPSQLHHYLRHYKSGAYPRQEQEFSLKVVSLLCHFLGKHRHCIEAQAGRSWNIITTVPSTSGRPGEHPLVKALRQVPSVFQTYKQLLEPGSMPLGHNRASDRGFRPTSTPLDNVRVLLVDDTFTSGARAQSAASALSNAGADVVAIVPIGRVIDPTWEQAADWWDHQRRSPFSFTTCCLE
jgi:hypothetical protein